MSETEVTPQQVLDLPLPGNDADAPTVRGYLVALLAELWREEEGFSGKRPFGNSCWQYEIYGPLVKAGFVPGSLDEDGYLGQVDVKAADALMATAIEALGSTS